MKSKSLRLAAGAIGAVALVVITAMPAAAYPFSYNMRYDSGRIRLVRSIFSQNFDTPTGNPPLCPSLTPTNSLTGQVTAASGPDNMQATLTLQTAFNDPIGGGNYWLSASGTTGVGANRGDFNDATDQFGNVVMPVAFSLSSLDTTTCVIGAVVCSGTITLTASGGSHFGPITPFDAGDQVYVNAGGTIDVVVPASGTCPGVIGLVLRDGATLTLGDNPNDNFPGGGSPVDQGAVFTQL